MTNKASAADHLLATDDCCAGLEPLDTLPPERHARRVLGMFHVIPDEQFSYRGSRFVYFARNSSGAIKIGSSCNPRKRVQQMQSKMREPLTLLGYLEGSFEREWHLHSAYSQERIHGEWFNLSDRLAALIARISAQWRKFACPRGGDAGDLLLPRRDGFR